MPIIKSAKKKLRQDKKRTQRNAVVKKNYKKAIKKARSGITGKAQKGATSALYSTLDKAVKKGLMHKNKAARLKSRISARKAK